MVMSEKSITHVDSCRFCWMCHHICPVGNATGQERCTPRARALGISLVNRGSVALEEIMDNIYECAYCGACVHDCVTGWDPVMFTKEVRLQAALEGKLPEYIRILVDNAVKTGNAYGKTELSEDLEQAFARHEKRTDTLLFLGTDARYKVVGQALKAIKVLEMANVDFTLIADEPASGARLDFLVGAVNETKEQMNSTAKIINGFKTVVIYDPSDAKTIKQTYNEYGTALSCKAVTYTSFIAGLLRNDRISAKSSEIRVVYQDPCSLSRDLGETEEPREIIRAYAKLDEMLLNRKNTVWAGNLLMSEYMPNVMRLVAERRIFNAESVGADTIVTASVSEYANLLAAAPDNIRILSIEDLILG